MKNGNKTIIFGVTLSIILVIIIAGFFLFNPSKKTTSSSPLEIALTLSDLPVGYSIQERSERLKSDVSEDALNRGWQSGYYTRYFRGENLADFTKIEQYVSVYPLENITLLLQKDITVSEEETLEKMPSQNMGDGSKSYRVTNNEFGNTWYSFEFIKKDVYVRLDMFGTATDYELLKSLAKKIENKI